MKRFFPMALAVFVLLGCTDQKAWIQKFAPKEDDQFTRQFIDYVRDGRYDEAKAMLDSAVTAKAGPNGLNQLHDTLQGNPVAMELLGANTTFFQPLNGKPATRQSDLTYQLHFRDAWVVMAFVVESNGSDRHIKGINFQPIPASLEYINRFTIENKTPIHLVFLVACIAIPLFIIVTVVICLFSRVRLRWLWAIFILIGFTQFQLNWSTGQAGFQPISFVLLGASFFRAGVYAPIVFGFGIPVGAILFLALRRWLLRKDESSDPAAPA